MLCATLVSASQERQGRVKVATDKSEQNNQRVGAMLYAERLKRLGVPMIGNSIFMHSEVLAYSPASLYSPCTEKWLRLLLGQGTSKFCCIPHKKYSTEKAIITFSVKISDRDTVHEGNRK